MDRNTKKVYTISEIASELGVSTTTVSRAISGKGRISQATRERVRAFVEKHDYSPNVVAKGLAKSKTYNLGLLLPMDFGASDAPFFSTCLNGICETASAHGYDIVISMTDGREISQLRRMIMNRKVDGVILSRAEVSTTVQDFLKDRGMPFVVIGPSSDPEIYSVDNNNQEASRELTSIMLMKGGRRLALFGGSQDYLVTRSRLQGFLEAHEQQGLMADHRLVFMDIENDVKAMNAVRQSLEEGTDGMVCMDDSICNMVLSCLRERGIRIPEDMRLASMYDSHQLQHNNPPVTALRFDAQGLGKNACAMLLQQLGEEVEQETEKLNYQMILRASTK